MEYQRMLRDSRRSNLDPRTQDDDCEQRALTLAVVGGASGVGKTEILKAVSGFQKLNTGDSFKECMTVLSRDDIRNNDWSIFEVDVYHKLSRSILTAFAQGENVAIDTHFAAKIHGRNYRIGLKRNLIFSLGLDLFHHGKNFGKTITIHLILITTDPHSLLLRRRIDTTRNRELVPSDCLNGLRSNQACASQYFSELCHAERETYTERDLRVKYHLVKNFNLDSAKEQLRMILKED